ncbi:hypothetical protein DFA_10138 [Cavenderia fasciculata]|uniref:Zinc finger CCCH domain-containing protein 14 n=1 Tax=Cavenderia fasciculata TaxID=261658 RepID=F4Q9D5_CACFS|nr:uncharacterized protein DFA_10138 [Cavenderia fasciculata]EGG15304.1 hypothetical protein DFA_10138 [Cavenderia fasciculata]|eukprot:XP_004352024.1 hypothetical protein DFA_10138 [Cavenderia fasciculata]
MLETLGSFEYTPEAVAFIQSEIKNHLDCDDILAEYIVVMVRNNKTKGDVMHDLSEFIPIDPQRFVDWLWTFVVSYMEIKREPSSSAMSLSSSTSSSAAMVDSPSAGTVGRGDVPKRGPPSSKLVLNAARAAAEDVKAHPSLSMSLDDRLAQDSKYNNKKKFNTRDNNNNNNNNNNKRVGNHNNNNNNNNRGGHTNSHGNNNNRQNTPNFKVTFTTLDSSSRKRKINNGMNDDEDEDSIDQSNEGTEDQHIIDEEEDDDEQQESMRSTKKSDKKERCQFWPMCKNQDTCSYFHPTTQCNLFPKCPYGEKCLYIHPSIPCKYGVGCTNPNCAFNHPQRPAAYDIPSVPPCRNGFACANKKFCSFGHPPIACKYGEACTKAPRCAFGHGKACMYGASCKTPSCTFAHHVDGSTTPPNSIPVDCRYGKDCTNASCIFQHPERQQQQQGDGMDESTDTLSNTLPQTPPGEQSDNSISTDPQVTSDATATTV